MIIVSEFSIDAEELLKGKTLKDFIKKNIETEKGGRCSIRADIASHVKDLGYEACRAIGVFDDDIMAAKAEDIMQCMGILTNAIKYDSETEYVTMTYIFDEKRFAILLSMKGEAKATTVKLHARVTREIEISRKDAERLVNYLSGCNENCDTTIITTAFTEGVDSGSYEEGYIPYEWLSADLEAGLKKLEGGEELLDYLNGNRCRTDDIDLTSGSESTDREEGLVVFGGKKYRTVEVFIPDYGYRKIAPESLQKALFNEDDEAVSEAAVAIDEEIFFYVDDDILNGDAKVIRDFVDKNL